MTLKKMISGGLTGIDEIAEYLDGITHAARLREIRTLGSGDMASLFHHAGRGEPVDMDQYVPANRPDLTEVVHYGLNSLPLFRRFQKRFCRSVDREGNLAIYGYNEGITRPFVGPGFFVTHPTQGNGHWETRGAVVIDYHLEPEGSVATGWPEFVPNHQGLQQMIYHRTRDFMRRVSRHASIGTAYKDETPLNVYFVLCRED